METGLTRRAFLGSAMAFGVMGMAGCASTSSSGTAGRLPAQGEYVIRNGYVMTMEPGVADIPEGSVHVRGGRIVAVGAGVEAPGAEAFDAALVDAERHGAPVVQQGVMPGGIRFAYVSAEQSGVPYIEIALIPSEIRTFFDYVKQEQQ